MLTKIRIKGYRALRDVELDIPAGQPLVLIGENATGKSSLLDALALLCAVADGRVGRAISDRSGWPAVAWSGSNAPIELLVRFSGQFAAFEDDGGVVEYEIRIGNVRSIPTVVDEQIRVYKRGLDQEPLRVLAAGQALNRQTKAFEPVPPASPEGSIVVNSRLAAIHDEARYPTPVHVRRALQSIAFYAPFQLHAQVDGEVVQEPFGARPVEHTPRIGRTGRDLLNALHTLSQGAPRAWEALLLDLGAVFPWCEAIKFPPGAGRGVVTMTWVDRRSGATLYLDDMSDGMRVYLALLAALHADDATALLAFDEPERSLHPRAMWRFVKAMELRARTTPVVVATHSDRLLDFLEDPAAALRVTRFSSTAGVRVDRFDREILDEWRKEYSLSELRARGMLDAPRTEEDEP
jgi:predicted ATPase